MRTRPIRPGPEEEPKSERQDLEPSGHRHRPRPRGFLNPCPIQITNPIVFHSRDDDGINRCLPLAIDESTETLHLYRDSNPTASTDPLEICVNGLDDGDEVCAFDVRIGG